MRLVILESPFAGKGPTKLHRWLDNRANIRYARQAMKDSILRGEAPMVSHLLYTQVLNDNFLPERKQGIEAGLMWRKKAEASVVYVDRGISFGMKQGMCAAVDAGVRVIIRRFQDGASCSIDECVLYDPTEVALFLKGL